jgi:hypothetical protein
MARKRERKTGEEKKSKEKKRMARGRKRIKRKGQEWEGKDGKGIKRKTRGRKKAREIKDFFSQVGLYPELYCMYCIYSTLLNHPPLRI